MSQIAGLSLITSRITAEGVSLRFVAAPSCGYFDGHFPGEPVLPGIAQLDLALQAARQLIGPDVALGGLRGLRLRLPIHPDDEFEVSLVRTVASHIVRLEIRVAEGVATAGVLLLATPLVKS